MNPSTAADGRQYNVEVALAQEMEQRKATTWPTDYPLRNSAAISRLASVEARVTAHVMAAAVVRPAVTLFDLHEELIAAAGVATFGEIGLGPSIYHVDIVRRLFKCSPSSQTGIQIPPPWRGVDFVRFIAVDDEAHQLLCAGGDAGALADAFARHVGYERGRSVGLHISTLPMLQIAVREQRAALAVEGRATLGRHYETDLGYAVAKAWETNAALGGTIAANQNASVTVDTRLTLSVHHGAIVAQFEKLPHSTSVRPGVAAAATAPVPPAAANEAPSPVTQPATLGRRRGRFVAATAKVAVVEPMQATHSVVATPYDPAAEGIAACIASKFGSLLATDPAAQVMNFEAVVPHLSLEAPASGLWGTVPLVARLADGLPVEPSKWHLVKDCDVAFTGAGFWSPWTPGYRECSELAIPGVWLLHPAYADLSALAKQCVNRITAESSILDTVSTRCVLSSEELRLRGGPCDEGRHVTAHDVSMPHLDAALAAALQIYNNAGDLVHLAALNALLHRHMSTIASYLAVTAVVESQSRAETSLGRHVLIPSQLNQRLWAQRWLITQQNTVISASDAAAEPSLWRSLLEALDDGAHSRGEGWSHDVNVASFAPLLSLLKRPTPAVDGTNPLANQAVEAYRRWVAKNRTAPSSSHHPSAFSMECVRHPRLAAVQLAVMTLIQHDDTCILEHSLPVVVPIADMVRASSTLFAAVQRDALGDVGVVLSLGDVLLCAQPALYVPCLVMPPPHWCRTTKLNDLSVPELARRWSLVNATVRDVLTSPTSSLGVALRGATATSALDARTVCAELQAVTIDMLTQYEFASQREASAARAPALVVPCPVGGYFVTVTPTASENACVFGVGRLAGQLAAAVSARTPRIAAVWCIDDTPTAGPLLARFMGGTSLRSSMRTHMQFSQITHAEAAGVMDQIHVTVVPWVQCLLATRFPRYYRAHREVIAQRLANLVVAVCSDDVSAVHTLSVVNGNHRDTFSVAAKDVRGLYSPDANTLFLNRTATTAHAMAPSCAAIFAVDDDDQPVEALKQLFAGTLGAPDVEKAVRDLAEMHGTIFRLLLGTHSSSGRRWCPAEGDALWEMPHMAQQRYSATFPPGTNPFIAVPSLPDRRFEHAARVVSAPRTIGAKAPRDAEDASLLMRSQPTQPAASHVLQLAATQPAGSQRRQHVPPPPPPVAGDAAVPVATLDTTFTANTSTDDDDDDNGARAEDGNECAGAVSVEHAAEVAREFAATLGPKTAAQHASFISFGTYVRPGAHGDTSVVDADALRNLDSGSYSRPAEQYVALLIQRGGPPRPLGANEHFVVRWMNEHGEQGTQYDVLCYIENRQTKTRSNVLYVEVKATALNNKRSFELSLRELLFAAERGDEFAIYRVFNAKALVPMNGQHGGGSVKVVQLRDPIAQWRRGLLTLKSNIEATFGGSTV